jgi:hypothetical protein
LCSAPRTKPTSLDPPFFSRLKIVLGSLGTDPGAGALPGFDGEDGGSAIAMRLAQRQDQARRPRSTHVSSAQGVRSFLGAPLHRGRPIDAYNRHKSQHVPFRIASSQVLQLRWTHKYASNHNPQVLLFHPTITTTETVCPTNLRTSRPPQARKISQQHSHMPMTAARPPQTRSPPHLP